MTNKFGNIDNDIPNQYKGDRLFKGDVDWWNNAVIDLWSLEKGLYATGYKVSGDLLVDHVIRNQDSPRHALVFPVIFLYRQYLEIRMKDIIIAGSELIGTSGDFPGNHRLDELWRKCRPLLEGRVDSTDLDMSEKYIQEFSDKDPTSQAFRYPNDRKGNLSLPENIIDNVINLRRFREVMGKIAAILDGASDDIYQLLQEKRSNETQNPC